MVLFAINNCNHSSPLALVAEFLPDNPYDVMMRLIVQKYTQQESGRRRQVASGT
jgi:hypothetical protein